MYALVGKWDKPQAFVEAHGRVEFLDVKANGLADLSRFGQQVLE